VGGGAITTAGGLVFIGTPEGQVVGLDAKTGEQLWAFNVGMGVTGSTITYAVGGKQYLASVAGGLPRNAVGWGAEPKLADAVRKMNFGGMVIGFGLAE